MGRMRKRSRKSSSVTPATTPDNAVQVIGSPLQMMSGKQPILREMTLDDIEDDCPICQANRDLILTGNAPMVYAFD